MGLISHSFRRVGFLVVRVVAALARGWPALDLLQAHIHAPDAPPIAPLDCLGQWSGNVLAGQGLGSKGLGSPRGDGRGDMLGGMHGGGHRMVWVGLVMLEVHAEHCAFEGLARRGTGPRTLLEAEQRKVPKPLTSAVFGPSYALR
jgi:hypothetical protein